VFYFIFVAVGAVLVKERSEDRRQQQRLAKQELAEMQAARTRARGAGADRLSGQTALRESS
jgi:hypothetical protein